MTAAAITTVVSVPMVESFDYTIISADAAEQLRRSAASIRSRIAKTTADIIETGRRPCRRGHVMSDLPQLDQLLLHCRMEIAEAYFHEGPEAALVAVANASMMLAPLVLDGELLAAPAWDALQEVSENLTLVETFGQDAVQETIAFGPRLYVAYRRSAELRSVA